MNTITIYKNELGKISKFEGIKTDIIKGIIIKTETILTDLELEKIYNKNIGK